MIDDVLSSMRRVIIALALSFTLSGCITASQGVDLFQENVGIDFRNKDLPGYYPRIHKIFTIKF
jgi:hypothetical protein